MAWPGTPKHVLVFAEWFSTSTVPWWWENWISRRCGARSVCRRKRPCWRRSRNYLRPPSLLLWKCCAAMSWPPRARRSLNPGVRAFLDWLDERGVRRAVLSRNLREGVEMTLRQCGLCFDLVLGREDAIYKPNPHGLLYICACWGLEPAQVLMVGDYLHDIQAGRNAGTRTALVTHGRTWSWADQADIVFPNFESIPEALRHWIG